jgi:Fic family protein
MAFSEYNYYSVTLVEPDFRSELTDLIIDLDHLRRKEIHTRTPPGVFRQIIDLFHKVESLGSARIEGNNTQMMEWLRLEHTGVSSVPEGVVEIRNMETTLKYIDAEILHNPIERQFIQTIHTRIMKGLRPPPAGDGDSRAGDYHTEEVVIAHSEHMPPPPWDIAPLMNELTEFMESDHPPKYDLLKASMFHHRFTWIYPLFNGNGRTVRMLTYAILIKQGFILNDRRIINLSSAFCLDRQAYYHALSRADQGDKDGTLFWCSYMLKGLRDEIQRIDRLAEHDFLKNRIFLPALRGAEKSGAVSSTDLSGSNCAGKDFDIIH